MRQIATIRELFLYSHYLSVGNDRLRRYEKARREARKGSISIFDRFPYESPLDGPEIKEAGDENNKNLVGFFYQREQKVYKKFVFPDLIIILKVTPEISQKRKPDHRLETIQEKDAAIERLQSRLRSSTAKNWVTQNADIPIEEVFLELKRNIWSIL